MNTYKEELQLKLIRWKYKKEEALRKGKKGEIEDKFITLIEEAISQEK